MRRLKDPRAWWHGGEAVIGDVDCFFRGPRPREIFLIDFQVFFLFANEGLEAGDLLMEQVFLKTACGGASFEGANIDTKSCPDLQVAKKGLCILYT